MLPRWHILWGIIFTLFIWKISPETEKIYLFLIFFASVFIDFDHYVNAVRKTGKLSLKKAFEYHKKREKELNDYERKHNKKIKGDFHIFHTVEFHLFLAVLGIFWLPFFYLFLGMIFHSFLDMFHLIKIDRIHRREYFFFNWLRKRF